MESYLWYDCPADPTEAAVKGCPTVAEALFEHVRGLEEDQSDVHLQNVVNARLYSNRELMAFEWQGLISRMTRPLNANLENIIQSNVDTLASRITQARVKPVVQARGADFKAYLRARQLDRFVWGEFVAHRVHAKAERMFRDSVVYGTGFLSIDKDRNTREVCVENVHPDEIVVDQRECISGRLPFQMHRRRLVSRLWLLKVFPEHEEAIKAAQPAGFTYTSYRSPKSDMLVLVESWKRPTVTGGGDGHHAIVCQGATLVFEKYSKDYFPIVDLPWIEAETGFYGRALVTDLLGYQLRQSELNELIQVGQNLACVPRLLVEQGSLITGVTHFDNDMGKALVYRGVKPEIAAWNAFPPELYNERERNKQSAFEFAGQSPFMAQGKAPSNQTRYDSSEALQLAINTFDERFNTQVQRYEEVQLTIAERIIDLTRDLYKNERVNRATVYKTTYIVDQIDWKSVNMERDKYVLQVAAASIASQTPAARRDKLNTWFSQGLITPPEYKALCGEPDLERLCDRLSATADYCECNIDKMLDGQTVTPTGYDDLATCYKNVHAVLMRIRMLEAPPEIVVLFENYLLMVKDLMEPPTPEPGALPPPTDAAMPMGAPAPGQPGAMPLSPNPAMTPMGGPLPQA